MTWCGNADTESIAIWSPAPVAHCRRLAYLCVYTQEQVSGFVSDWTEMHWFGLQNA